MVAVWPQWWPGPGPGPGLNMSNSVVSGHTQPRSDHLIRYPPSDQCDHPDQCDHGLLAKHGQFKCRLMLCVVSSGMWFSWLILYTEMGKWNLGGFNEIKRRWKWQLKSGSYINEWNNDCLVNQKSFPKWFHFLSQVLMMLVRLLIYFYLFQKTKSDELKWI